mmetsp:Transcript_71696/g.126559  ORF Transcript_71696/g.126559 Transcript_71696/m.126559 type:complete len:100 (+) Transcript_71696:301-600(+)
MALFGVMFAGEALFDAIKVPMPDIVATARENKMMSFMMIWMVGNMISGNLLNSGAFEIQHGDQVIWSSLEQKRLPNMQDLMTAFAKTGVEFIQLRQDEA